MATLCVLQVGSFSILKLCESIFCYNFCKFCFKWSLTSAFPFLLLLSYASFFNYAYYGTFRYLSISNSSMSYILLLLLSLMLLFLLLFLLLVLLLLTVVIKHFCLLDFSLRIWKLKYIASCATWLWTRSLSLRGECRLRMFKNRILRRIFGPKRDENGE